MAGRSYNLLREYTDVQDADDISSSPHWALAFVRLAKPLSYSRATHHSVSLDVSEAVQTRGPTLVVTGDCLGLDIQGSKESHLKMLQAQLIQTDRNYLTEIQPGDWVLAWIVHSQDELASLVDRIRQGKPCNGFDDGLKFVGRVESRRKRGHKDPQSGSKTVRYAVSAYGFRELDSQIFYDRFLAESSVEKNDLGRWLAKVGLDIRDVFASEADSEQKDNAHILITSFLEILVGTGVGSQDDGLVVGPPQLRQVTGGGVTEKSDGSVGAAPFAYLVPQAVGDLLNRASRSPDGGALAYADLLEIVFGGQKYEGGQPDAPIDIFTPSIETSDPLTKGNHRYTGQPLMGSFLPLMPNFDNVPLWSLLQQYLNPAVNEMYTCLRVNELGDVVPTFTLRQIPFTTDALAAKIDGSEGTRPFYTPFTGLPRWLLPDVLVEDYDVGTSDAARINFVHVYGQDADVSNNITITAQLSQNPPVRDDFDIQRSGLHTYMSTVACRTVNEVGTIPSTWMELVADRLIGGQWLLNGQLSCRGIRSPICEGDNVEWQGVVFHLEGWHHSCSLDSGTGSRSFRTQLTVSNGLYPGTVTGQDNETYPRYVGLTNADFTGPAPGTGAGGAPAAVDDVARDAEKPPFDPDSAE